MRTNIVIDDTLMRDALKATGAESARPVSPLPGRPHRSCQRPRTMLALAVCEPSLTRGIACEFLAPYVQDIETFVPTVFSD